MSSSFPHESLDCYRLAVSVPRWLAAVRFPARHADLADQALRASQSVVLNIAEGMAREGWTSSASPRRMRAKQSSAGSGRCSGGLRRRPRGRWVASAARLGGSAAAGK